MIPGGKSGPSLVAVSASYVLANIPPSPANCNFTSGSTIAVSHWPYIMIVPVRTAALRKLAKGATWKVVQDEIFFGVRE